jgi:HlyD family secretion protein
MKKTAIVALGALLVAGLVWVLGFRNKDIGPKYRTAKVDLGNVTQTVTATGTISAVTTVQVGSVVSGIVSALHADFNKEVKKGSLLAELDPTPFQARVAQSQASLDKANVDTRNAEISLRRQKALQDQGLAPQADLDQAQANFDSARAAVAQAQASLEQSQTDLKNSRIVAPIDGVVVARQYDVGQSVAASFQAPTLFTIAQDLTKMQVSADVSESDIGLCKVGQPVRFTVDAYPEQTFRGTISQIRLNASVNQNVVTYPVIVEVPNPDLALRPTMTANVIIDVATARKSLRVPNAALRWRPEEKEGTAAAALSTEERAARGGAARGSAGASRQLGETSGKRKPKPGQTIYTLSAAGLGDPKAVEIRTGISDGRFTQVVGGELKEGDTVVIGLVTTKADASTVPGAARGPGAPGGAGGGRRF